MSKSLVVCVAVLGLLTSYSTERTDQQGEATPGYGNFYSDVVETPQGDYLCVTWKHGYGGGLWCEPVK